jgi:predicted anti-sigma-YlaC factor YlaD
MKGAEVPCQEIVEWVTDYLEGALGSERQRLFEEHLADCPPCTLYLQQIQTTLATVGDVGDDDLSPEAWTTLRGAFRGFPRN